MAWFIGGLIVGTVIVITIELISKHKNKKRLNQIDDDKKEI